MSYPILSFEQIVKLREAAAATAADYPYRPLLLEMALIGLSRWSIAGLEMSSFMENAPGQFNGEPVRLPYAVVWRERNNVIRRTRMSELQWQIAQNYLHWRVQHVFIKSPALFVAKARSTSSYWKAMKPERVRSEIRSLGREAYLGNECLEIPDLHRGMANWMRLKGIPEKIIFESYGNKNYIEEGARA